ncbi:Glutaredoxin [Handroanthus impetiginosus]|uniref:Glutaredoxin n=1 Tax=Handroanthus impetiginosus TaxID=429701 RepID=A0A2G9FXQ3_9LAMI|nr:Glutaredoxin [Handroanthus impetiginosus]
MDLPSGGENHDFINGHHIPTQEEKGGENLFPDKNGNPPQEDMKTYQINPDSQKKVVNGGENSEMIRPHSQLPKPEAPPGVMERSRSLPETLESPASTIGKFLREKSNSVSAAITKRISFLTKDDDDGDEAIIKEFNLVGLKVIKTLKDERKELKGRISFFSRSNCRDCGAVRSFLRERNLNFVEINVDVYPAREKELIERTGGTAVPQIFFNEKLIGGLVALNSLRNSGILEAKMEEILGRKCPEDAPAAPVYGFDEEEEVEGDEMVAVVRVVRQRVPIQDRIMKMKFVKNCFSGAELVEALIHHFDCGRRKAIEIGKQLARKHFIHHVFGENEFEDGNHFYRFLEHEQFIPKCYNFRGVVNDCEPKAAAAVSQRITCIMSAILESYASDDRCRLDFTGISNSEEFRRYVNLVEDLQRVNLLTLSHDEKLAFFLNLHNAMAIHAVIRIGHPGGMIDRRAFFSEFMYVMGGYPYSLSSIKNGILRNNRRPPFSLIKPFGNGDRHLELAFPKVNQLIHFGIWNATRGSPSIRFYTPQSVESELRNAAREYFHRSDGMQVDLAKRTVYLPRLIKWYSADFGQEKEILKWIVKYLDASKAGLLTHLLSDGGSIKVVYQNYDWSLNF